MRLINLVIGLFLLLPWWAALGVLGALIVGLVLYARRLFSRVVRNVTDEIVAQGTPLTDAVVSIHSVQRTGVPARPSPFDSGPEDEDYEPDLDGTWSAEDGEFFLIDATIAPQHPDAVWMPGNLSLIRADFEPEEPLEACLEVGLLHSAEIFRDGRFVPLGDEEVTGPQRLRMLFAATPGIAEAKFAYHFNYFGRLQLPTAVAAH
jgi:hypothetical protein